jgi:hypothetical protein
MPAKRLAVYAAIVSSCVGLASCGGGGDSEAGSITPFKIVPDAITLTAAVGSPAGVCASDLAGAGSRVFVYGGAAPYRLDNTNPDALQLDRSVVNKPGEFFVVWAKGGCVDPAIVVIVDALDRQVSLRYINEPAN